MALRAIKTKIRPMRDMVFWQGVRRRNQAQATNTLKDARTKCLADKSAIAEHAWTNGHPINWNGTKILQRTSRTMQLVLKEVLSIHTTLEDTRFNRDSGYELPDCWIATYNKLKGGASFSSAYVREARSGMH